MIIQLDGLIIKINEEEKEIVVRSDFESGDPITSFVLNWEGRGLGIYPVDGFTEHVNDNEIGEGFIISPAE